jgi:hypothetical protein
LWVLKKIGKRTLKLMKMRIMTTKKKTSEALEQFLFLMLEMTAIFFRKQEGFSLLYVIYYKKMNSKGAQRKASSGNRENK